VSQYETNMCFRDFIIVRLISSGYIKNNLLVSFGYLSILPLFSPFLKALLII